MADAKKENESVSAETPAAESQQVALSEERQALLRRYREHVRRGTFPRLRHGFVMGVPQRTGKDD